MFAVNSRFAGKVALVTGGTGGLGRSVAEAFLAEGAQVIVTYRKPQEFDLLKQAAGAKATLRGQSVDVTDAAVFDKFVEQLVAEHGHLDFVVNTIGGYAGGLKLWETHPTAFEQMLTLNLRAGFTICRAVVPLMLKQGRGAIVNVAARAAFEHAAGAGAYAASKAAAVAMIDCLAADLKGTAVRVNSVLPSIIDTEANRKAMPHANFAQWPKPTDIARVILFLCSDDARLVHGAAVPVYGSS
jgi:NAD(P)-dependent dehydrogenase (short-subunit alcohol dehydrogenase family)